MRLCASVVRFIALVLVTSPIAATSTWAATWRWTGLDPTSSAWSRAQNWDLLTAPANDGTAILVFGDLAPSARHDPVADLAWDIASLEIAGDQAYAISGASLSLHQGIALRQPSLFGLEHRVANDVLLLSDNDWSNASAAALVATGAVSLGAHTLTLTPEGFLGTSLQGDISGTGRLVKEGAGPLRLSGDNTFSGGTTVTFGLLIAQGPHAIPPGTVAVRMGLLDLGGTGNVLGPGDAALDGLVLGGLLGASASVTGLPIRIATQGDWIVYDATDGTSETLISGTLDLDSPGGTRVIRIADSFSTMEEITILASIANPGSLPGPAPAIRKVGPGHLILTGLNTFARALQIEEGVVLISRPEALGAAGPGDPTVVLAGATLELQSPFLIPAETLRLNGAGVAGTGALRSREGSNEWSGAVVLESDAAVGAASGGPGLTISGAVGGAGGLTKVGDGILRLTAANAYAGATVAGAGVLRADNAIGHAIPGAVTVASGGVLAGDGSVGGPILVEAGGILDPSAAGAAAASLAAPAATFAPGSTLRLDLAANDDNARLDLAGPAQLAGRLELRLVAPYVPAAGHIFTLVLHAARSGEFTDLSLPPLPAGLQWALDYGPDALTASVTGATDVGGGRPLRTRLAAPAPNPFTASTGIGVELARPARARVEIVDLEGRLVSCLLDESRASGAFTLEWTGLTSSGRPARSGVYFARLLVDGRVETPVRRLVLVR